MKNKSIQNMILSLLIPCIACTIQWVFWDKFQPFLWLLLYPAVFFSAQVGGRWGGMAATILSAFLAVFFFVEPVFSLHILSLNALYSVLIFILMGFLFSNLQERFKREQQKLLESESALRKLNDELEERVNQRALELQKTESRYQLIADNAADVIWVLNPAAGKFTYVSPSVEKLRGYTPKEVLEQSVEASLTPESLKLVRASLAENLPAFIAKGSGTESFVNEVDQPHKNGSIVHTEATTTYTFNQQGEVEVVGVSRDITLRKKAEESLREREQKLSTILNLLPVGVSILDGGKKVVFQNSSLLQILDITAEGLQAGTYKERSYLTYDGTPMPPTGFASAQSEKSGTAVYHVETGMVKANGATVWTSVSAVPVDFLDWKTVIVTADITARKQAEKILQDERRNLDALIENTDASIWSVDMQYQLILGNARYHHDTSAALGRRLLEGESVLLPGFPQAALDEWRGYYDRALQGENFSVEVQTRFADPVRYVEYRFNPIRTSTGAITGVTVFGRDITERKQAEKALHISLTKYKTLFESFPLGITISGPAGDILETNAIAEKLLGISQEEPIKREIDGAEWRIIRPDGNPMSAEEYASARALKENRKVENVEMGIVKPDDSVTWINVTAAPLLLEEYGVVITYQDITERKKAEEALQESEARFRALFYNLPLSGVVYRLIRDAQNEIVDLEIQETNKSGAADIGGTPSDLLGKKANALFGMETMKPYLELCRRVVASNKPEQLETHFDHNNKYYLSSVFAVGSNHYANISIDITDRKRMENELRRSNTELEQFAYIASHDMQEPLRTLTGMVQLLKKRYQGKLDERADEYIGHAVESAARMQALIKDLLAYSRVGRKNQSIPAVSTQDCLQTALKNLSVAIEESHASITSSADLPTVHADPTQLTQLFQNLIGNSIKFRGAEPPQVHITAAQLNGAWQFAVRDNGIGIEPQYFERIFLVFQRLHTRREYAGTGIGLALCKKIVERHGGDIRVESQPGEGSTFYFTMPLRSNQ